MTKYTHADFVDDDSVNSVQLTEGISTSATHIRYHTGTSMWKQRTRLEKVLLAVVATLVFVTLVLIIAIHSEEGRIESIRAKNEQPSVTNGDSKQPCLNRSCVIMSSQILEAIDPSIDPCDDFYSYACNGWVNAHPIPDGRSSWSKFTKLEQQNQLVIKRVLEQPIESLKSKAEQKAKTYYDSCLDANDTTEHLGGGPMIEVIKNLGGWNVTDSGFLPENWSLQKSLQLIQNRYSIGALFSYDVEDDDKNSTRHIMQIDQSGLTLPTRDYYLNKTTHGKVLDAYLDYMTKVGVLLGGEENATRAQMQAVIEFETKLANITIPSTVRRDEETLYKPMTVEELQKRAPFIEWLSFFNDAMRIVGKKIDSNKQVAVYAQDYLGNLTGLIKEYHNTTETKIVLNNYLVWQVVKSFAGYLSKAFRDAHRGLKKALLGSEAGEQSQWRFCVQDTNNVLGFAVGAIFVREVFHQDSKLQAEEMINNVRQAFKKNFKNLKWMDEETRKAAIIKADAISDMIGFPDFIKNSTLLDEKYETLTVRNDTYFKNNINIIAYNRKKNLEKADEPVNRTTWNMAPSTVNAYYTSTKNQMVLPAGILQRPFYDASFPLSINYGGIGVVMGHELTHAFDDQGREFDKDGNLNQWWNNQTIDRFKERTKCVVDQYDKYKINDKNINGNQTLCENMADNGGLKAAYHAYLEVARSRPDPPPLPGLRLNHRQLFFVAFAQVWCSAVTKEETVLHIEKDSHSVPKYRVVGALSNLKEFSREFKCKPGSNMNPRNKCEVW